MQPIIRRLNQLARQLRLMLLTTRCSQAAVALVLLFVVGGAVDYVLNLPGLARAVLGPTVLALLAVWVLRRVYHIVNMQLPLTLLALRIERLHPPLAGLLACAVEIEQSRQVASSGALAGGMASNVTDEKSQARQEALAKLITARCAQVSAQASIKRVIDRSLMLRWVSLLLLVCVVAGSIVVASPQAAATAWGRWTDPLGDAAWPKRTEIQTPSAPTWHAVDQPLALTARITRGDRQGLRVTARYQLVDQDGQPIGPWQSILLNRQGDAASANALAVGRYAQWIDVPANVVKQLDHGQLAGASLRWNIVAGDAQSPMQYVELATRPRVTDVVMTIEPPAYAAGLAPTQTIRPDVPQQSQLTVNAWLGSQVTVICTTNKRIDPQPDPMVRVLESDHQPPPVDAAWRVRVGDDDTGQLDRQVEASFTLSGNTLVRSNLRDALGLAEQLPIELRFVARIDQLPQVHLSLPQVDQDVLATAVVPAEAQARDDLSVEQLTIQARLRQVPTRDQPAANDSTDDQSGRDDDQPPSPAGPVRELTTKKGRSAKLVAQSSLSLAQFDPQVGDVIELVAIADDNFALGDEDHKPVRSTPRRLRVIDESRFVAQLRSELAAVRELASRVRRMQADVSPQTDQPARAADRQQQISTRLDRANELVRRMQGRMTSNQLDDQQLQTVLDQAQQQIDQAADASGNARAHLQSLAEQLAAAGQAASRDANQQPSGDPSGQGQGDQNQGEQGRDAQGHIGQGEADQGQPDQDDASQGDDAQVQPNDEPAPNQQGDQPDQPQADDTASLRKQVDTSRTQVLDSLDELVRMLDQGKDAAALQLKVRQLQAHQQALAQQTREMLPGTLGRTSEQLTDQQRQAIDALRERQDELAKQAQQLISQMQSTAQALDRQSDDDADRAAADAMREAAAIAKRQGLDEAMEQAGQDMARNQLAQAGQQQSRAGATLSEMLEQLGQAQERLSQLLNRRMLELAATLRRLIERQTAQRDRLPGDAQLADDADQARIARLFDDLVTAQRRLRTSTMAAAQQARTSQQLAPIAAVIDKAINQQAAALAGLVDRKAGRARVAQQLAIDRLTEALEELERAQEKQQQKQQADARAQQRKAYLELAQKQQALHDKTEPLAGPGQRNRREQATLRRLSVEQSELGQQVEQLQSQVANTLVFKAMHERIDQAIDRVVRQLGQGQARPGTLRDQRQIVSKLTAMAVALDLQAGEQAFDQPPQGDEQAGGGGGQGQGQQQMTPPLAELKLLRQLQADLLEQTRRVDDDLAHTPEDRAYLQQVLQEISTQQRELAQLGRQMIERLQRTAPTPGR